MTGEGLCLPLTLVASFRFTTQNSWFSLPHILEINKPCENVDFFSFSVTLPTEKAIEAIDNTNHGGKNLITEVQGLIFRWN